MKKRGATRRHGLAPLELVLPLLLFVMALMVNLATGGASKVRTQINARHEAWRSLAHRAGANDPHPGNWPDDARLDVSAASPSPIPFDSFHGHAVVRGPVLSDPLTGESHSRVTTVKRRDFPTLSPAVKSAWCIGMCGITSFSMGRDFNIKA